MSHLLSAGLLDFSVNLYKLFTNGDDNIFMSPYSVSAALLLANLGANSSTEQQIRSALGVTDLSQGDVHKLYKTLQDSLNGQTQGSTTLAIANRMFARLGLEVSQKYIEEGKNFYGTELELMDFVGKPEESRVAINKWVEEQTRDKIKDILPPRSIDALSLMVLVNAIYFKGTWLEKFDSGSTTKVTFKMHNNETQEVDMMNAKRKVRFHADVDMGCSAVQLPYKSGNIATIFILPDAVDGLSKFEADLSGENLRVLCEKVAQGGQPEVILGIPKFKMEANYDLTKALPHLGITDMFGDDADFSAMLPANPDAYVSDVIHKAFVEVNEEGTEAAAATAIMMRCRSMPMRPQKFILDHPFIFIIRDTQSGSILFMGRYNKPPKQ